MREEEEVVPKPVEEMKLESEPGEEKEVVSEPVEEMKVESEPGEEEGEDEKRVG